MTRTNTTVSTPALRHEQPTSGAVTAAFAET